MFYDMIKMNVKNTTKIDISVTQSLQMDVKHLPNLLCLPLWQLLKLPSSGKSIRSVCYPIRKHSQGMSSARSAENQPLLRDITEGE
jgi:hypothetical protein